MRETGGGKQVYRKLSAAERGRFLAVMRETGNRKAAAAAIGVEPRLMDQRREHDPELDRDWEAAAQAAHDKLSAASGPFDMMEPPSRRPGDGAAPSSQDRPFDTPQGAGLNMVRRGKTGRLQLVAAGESRWTASVEERFKAALRESGNIRGAARAVGFSESAIWQRRRQWPAFAQMLEEMLDEAELALEFRIASMASNVVATEAEMGTVPSNCPLPPPPLDLDAAMRFLKWRQERRRGRGRWASRAKPPSIEEVTDKLVRRVEAIKRHRAREAEK